MKAHRQLLLACLLSVAGACATSDASQDASQKASQEASQHVYEPLPGAQDRSSETASRLRAARAALGADYAPRTEHRAASGAARFVNRLILETSPYLLQHAHNPVDWHSWGDEAFATAKRLDRPILLSVGYATCHWCHVMERESFEDLEIARFINQHFVAIKVDREERPDVDAVFMSAVQMMTGRGGWPMTVFLTPGGEPFYGGTYFPARDGDRGATVGFLTLLDRIRAGYDGSRGEVLAAGERLTAAIRRQLEAVNERAPKLPTTEVINSTAASFQQRFDAVHGGTRGAPKFPSTLPLRLLLRHHQRTGSAGSLTMVETTLDRMARGGIYDQVGGGFHRYATDGRWLVPHFEKMLYDNALLVVAYLEAFQATGRSDFAATARSVLDYLAREMSAAGGGFYSATDADSPAPGGHDEEGLFFTWTPAELESVLGGEPSRILAAYFAVAADGNFEGRSILHRPESTAVVAEQLQLTVDEVSATVTAALPKLYAERSERQPPLLDDKVLTAWNGLAISAFASAAAVLDNPAYAQRAEQAGEFLWQHLRPIVPDGETRRLMRSYRTGRANEAAVLEDYAFVIAGYLDLYETTHRPLWLDRARQLQSDLDSHYAAPGGGYFRTADDAEKLLAREIPTTDGAIPSGNSIATLNLLRLAALTDDDAYRATADSWLLTLAERLQTTPTTLTELQLALDFRHARVLEVVIVAPDAEGWQPFLYLLHQEFLPAKVVVATTTQEATEHARSVPLLTGKIARNGQTTAYLCEQGVCQLPTTDLEQFAEQLAGWSPVHGGTGNVQ